MSSNNTPSETPTPHTIPSHEDNDARFNEDRLKEEEYIYEHEEYHFGKAKTMSNCASVIFEIIKNVGLKKGGSLTSVACPAALLKRFSLLEMYCYTSQPKAYLEGLEKMTAEERIINISKWWMENQMVLPQQGVQDVKPANPILGEQFHATFQHANSTTTYLAEQVSHHPPITAVYIENKKEGFTFEQTHQPKSTFWGNSAYSVIEGVNLFTLPRLGESYTITNADVNLKNLIFGTSYLALEGKTVIQCKKTGYTVTMDYKKKNNLVGTIEKEVSGTQQKLYNFEGSLDGVVKWKRATDSKYIVFLDSSKIKTLPRRIEPVFKQKKNESRRVWHGVAFALYHRNFDEALQHKTQVEEFQRKVRKTIRREEDFVPHYFVPTGEEVGNTPIYQCKERYTGDNQAEENGEAMD